MKRKVKVDHLPLLEIKVLRILPYQVLALYGITTPPVVNFLSYTIRTIMAAPWATTTRPLALVAYHPLLTDSRKNFLKFLGDGMVTIDEHINASFAATHILGIGHEDVDVRLFVETLTDNVAD